MIGRNAGKPHKKFFGGSTSLATALRSLTLIKASPQKIFLCGGRAADMDMLLYSGRLQRLKRGICFADFYGFFMAWAPMKSGDGDY